MIFYSAHDGKLKMALKRQERGGKLPGSRKSFIFEQTVYAHMRNKAGGTLLPAFALFYTRCRLAVKISFICLPP